MAGREQFGRLCVVLVRARNPLNIGAAARAMSNFGFSCLRVVKPYEAGFREARSAVGASEILARTEQCDTVVEGVSDCTLVVGTTSLGRRELRQPVQRLDAGAALIRKHLSSGRVALLFGSEKIGLRNEDLSHCHWLVRIPTREEHRSMNLGQAVAVCLYELARDVGEVRETERMRAAPTRGTAIGASQGHLSSHRTSGSKAATLQNDLAPSGEVERLTNLLLEALHASGYLKGRSSASEEKVRRMVRRLGLDAADAEILLGMVRQMLWKMAPSGARGPG